MSGFFPPKLTKQTPIARGGWAECWGQGLCCFCLGLILPVWKGTGDLITLSIRRVHVTTVVLHARRYQHRIEQGHEIINFVQKTRYCYLIHLMSLKSNDGTSPWADALKNIEGKERERELGNTCSATVWGISSMQMSSSPWKAGYWHLRDPVALRCKEWCVKSTLQFTCLRLDPKFR